MLGAEKVAHPDHIKAAKAFLRIFAETLDLNASVHLWDGSVIALGSDVTSDYRVVIRNAGVLSSLVRRPTQDNLLLHYARGGIRLEGGDPLGFVAAVQQERGFKKLRSIPKWRTARAAWGVSRAEPQHAAASSLFRREERDESSIRFHYDIGNEFYALFLGDEMQYSCGLFENEETDLDQAQEAKLESICSKLQLESGEKFLDVGCGWGGLIRYAARRYGVKAHGLTLSPEQHEFATKIIRKQGLESQVTIELAHYKDVQGTYDKIASIEMIEHVGLANYPTYFKKLRSLLRPNGLFLNQGTTRRAKRDNRKSKKLSAGSRLMERYVFPGFELDNIGHTISVMEAARFEVHQVHGWRNHYARTTALWCRRLWARQDEAAALVGDDTTRMWLAYLAGVSIAFRAGTLRVYQVLASKQVHERRR